MGYFSKFNKVVYDTDCFGTGTVQVLTDLTSSVIISDALVDNTSFYNHIVVNDGERIDQLSQRLYGTPDYYWTFILINKNIKNVWQDWPKSTNQIIEYCQSKHSGFSGIVRDGSLNSTIFTIGEEVYTEHPIYNRGVVKSVSTNIGSIMIEPQHYCSLSTSIYDYDRINNKNECISQGGTWNICTLKTDENVSIKSLPIEHSEDETRYVNCLSIVEHKDGPHHFIEDLTGEVVGVRETGVTPISNFEFEEWINDKQRGIKVIRPEYIADIVAEFEKEISKSSSGSTLQTYHKFHN